MRTRAPPPLRQTFTGPEGDYIVDYRPIDDWDGEIDVTISGQPMNWGVVSVELENDGTVVLGGMTTGTDALWGDQFWFELRYQDAPPVIRYWGNQVLWREDGAAEPKLNL